MTIGLAAMYLNDLAIGTAAFVKLTSVYIFFLQRSKFNKTRKMVALTA